MNEILFIILAFASILTLAAIVAKAIKAGDDDPIYESDELDES